MKILRIVCCILSCLCLAALVPIAIFFEWWCLMCLFGAFIFGGLMFLFIRLGQPKRGPRTDFMKSEEENAEILQERKQREEENGENGGGRE